jgi:hypothetical protein
MLCIQPETYDPGLTRSSSPLTFAPTTRPTLDDLWPGAYPSALGPSTSGGSFTTPRSRAALTASTSGPELVLSSVHAIAIHSNG